MSKATNSFVVKMCYVDGVVARWCRGGWPAWTGQSASAKQSHEGVHTPALLCLPRIQGWMGSALLFTMDMAIVGYGYWATDVVWILFFADVLSTYVGIHTKSDLDFASTCICSCSITAPTLPLPRPCPKKYFIWHSQTTIPGKITTAEHLTLSCHNYIHILVKHWILLRQMYCCRVIHIKSLFTGKESWESEYMHWCFHCPLF